MYPHTCFSTVCSLSTYAWVFSCPILAPEGNQRSRPPALFFLCLCRCMVLPAHFSRRFSPSKVLRCLAATNRQEKPTIVSRFCDACARMAFVSAVQGCMSRCFTQISGRRDGRHFPFWEGSRTSICLSVPRATVVAARYCKGSNFSVTYSFWSLCLGPRNNRFFA